MRGREVASRLVHIQKIAGAIPAPASTLEWRTFENGPHVLESPANGLETNK